MRMLNICGIPSVRKGANSAQKQPSKSKTAQLEPSSLVEWNMGGKDPRVDQCQPLG